MKGKPARYRTFWQLAGAAAVVVAMPWTASDAQDLGDAPKELPEMAVPDGVKLPEPSEMPVIIAPVDQVANPVPPPRTASVVQVGELGALEGPLAGTLDNSTGSLGTNEWQGSDRPAMVTMLDAVPAAAPSATERLLIRKLLLTPAPPPPGRVTGSFNQLRLSRLLDGGYVADAASLALRMQEPNNFDLLRLQTDAFLYAGHDDDACSDFTSHRFDSAEPFWVELRAYCYALTNDSGPLDLTRSVITEQGIADPAFVTLLDGWTSGKPVMPDSIRFPDSIHIAMLRRLKLPMTTEIATDTGLPASLIAAASQETPAAIRMAAAQKALRAGILPEPVLEQVLDLTRFSAQDLDGAAALAPTEPLMKALARLRAAISSAHTAESRADLVHTAFEIGEREGLLRQVAELFAGPAAQLMPSPDWSRWSGLMVRGLLLAGRAEAAQRWLDVLDPAAPGNAVAVQQLELAFALTAPNPRRNADAKQVLLELARAVQLEMDKKDAGDKPDMPMATSGDVPVVDLHAKPSPELIGRAILDLGVFDAAAGDLMPSDGKSAVEPLMGNMPPGRRPAAVLMQRIDKAALSDSRGEVALSVATAIGNRGPGDLAPDIVVRLIRALQTANMRDAAHSLAMEAFLLRPLPGPV